MAKGKFTLYADAAGEFRWNLKAANGEIIADSNEGYKSFKDCHNGVKLVISHSKSASIEDTTGNLKAPAKKGAAKGAKKAGKKKAAKKK